MSSSPISILSSNPTNLPFNVSTSAFTAPQPPPAPLPSTTTTTVSALSLASFIGTNAQFVNESVRHHNEEDDVWISPSGVRSGDDTMGSSTICQSWQQCGLFAAFILLIIVTLIGNTLVILAVFTTRRLRTVTNCFVMSLALADWLVGVFVMPPAVSLFIAGSWQLGWVLCDIWISLDVLLCTASILSLCAISLDRYLAVTQPISYSKRRRSKRLATIMIVIVWLISLVITCPPYFGWYDNTKRFSSDMFDCHYNQNKGYVVFSAMGSFFIPCFIMLYVYSKIFCILVSRQSSIAKTEVSERSYDIDADNFTSDMETSVISPHLITKSSYSAHNIPMIQIDKDSGSISRNTMLELVEMTKSSRSSAQSLQSSAASSTRKLSASTYAKPYPSVQFTQSTLSMPESCLSASRFKVHSHGNRMPMRITTLRRETKMAQTLSMVVGGFVACWLPFFVCYLMMPFVPPHTISEGLMSFLTWLGWVNSAINPFIYAFYNDDFRHAFWRLTCKILFKKHKRNDLSYLKN